MQLIGSQISLSYTCDLQIIHMQDYKRVSTPFKFQIGQKEICFKWAFLLTYAPVGTFLQQNVNNYIAKSRLDAWNIQELPLLAARY